MTNQTSGQPRFDFGPIPVLSPRTGDENFDVFEGYYLLERDERNAMRDALARHAEEVTLWYGLLSNHRRTLEGTHASGSEVGFSTRLQILGLGLTSSKAALDSLLAGYYSIAFASIRHMTECWFWSRYLACHPEKFAGFYARKPGSAKVKLPSDTDAVVYALKECNHPHAPADLVSDMKQMWVNMSKGAHVTGIGLAQTMSDKSGVFHIGGTYDEEMAVCGFRHGLFTGCYLVRESLWHMRGHEPGSAEVANDIRRGLDRVLENIDRAYGKNGNKNQPGTSSTP